MRLLTRWLSDSLGIGMALLFAILAMQAPAFTHEYASTLLQVSRAARADIDQREASARQFYAISGESDDALVAALREREPSNAETLAWSLDKARALQESYDRLSREAAVLQPLGAFADAWDDPHGYKAEIWRTLLRTYDVQISFTQAAAIYGGAGLLLGSLLAHLLISLARVARPRRAAQLRY